MGRTKRSNWRATARLARAGLLVGMVAAIAAHAQERTFTGGGIAQADSDADTVGDVVDNCTLVVNPDQRDSNGEGFGNLCDADFDNNGVVNFLDLGHMKSVFFSDTDEDVDMNGDGTVNFFDLGLLKGQFFKAPGPGSGGLITFPVDSQPFSGTGYRVLAANDLGMHCADLDYQVMSILPPYNVVHAQVVRRGTATTLPQLVLPDAGNQPELVYSAASSTQDPALASPPAPGLAGTPRAAVSINSTSRNDSVLHGELYKSNFWEINPRTGHTYGYDAYGVLYPGDALSLFEPIPHDLGLPVPDPAQLPNLVVAQQALPSAVSHAPYFTEPFVSNSPQAFARFDTVLPFFANFPFGSTVQDVNWWSADGIPMMPIDDAGRAAEFPLMRIQARNASSVLASLDVVLPVASEADCQLCHVDPTDCTDPRLPPEYISTACTGAAISPTQFSHTQFVTARIDDAPGTTIVQQLLNAAKINVLRLHDAKHGSSYTLADGSPAACDPRNPGDPDCLDNQQPVQCARCHYTPALDLAQVGPIDEPQVGPHGRQQTRHVTMSRALHDNHGQYTTLFPPMPPPVDQNGVPRPPDVAAQILEETCYACHPGKRTKCLRGVMADAGIVCQDCHGGMPQVGNDFSENLPVIPFPGGADLSKRVPWANEPACQSCHTGDALTNFVGDPGTIAAPDGIRLLQAYLTTDPDAKPIQSPGSRFAAEESLYRLSKGHGGVMCEGCHGSTHAEWPVINAAANDNVAATQLQGHEGMLIECTSCHEPTTAGLPLNLQGPHGMHPISDYHGPDHRWNTAHGEIADGNGRLQCRGCHGPNGEGTELAATATNRRLKCGGGGQLCRGENFFDVPRDTQIGCGACHANPFGGGRANSLAEIE